MESEFPDRIPWENRYYSDRIFPNKKSLNSVECKLCNTSFPNLKKTIPSRLKHLKEEHYITELTDHPERGFFYHNFLINAVESTAKCFTCEKVISFNKYGLYLLKNHLEIYHGVNSYSYTTIAETKIGCDTLDKYFIINTEAACPKCELKIDLIGSELKHMAKINLKTLLEHYISHSFIPEHIRHDWIRTVDKEISELKDVNLDAKEYIERHKSQIEKYTELRRQREEPKQEIRMAFNKTESEITVLHE